MSNLYLLIVGTPDERNHDDIAATLRLYRGLHGTALRVMHAADTDTDGFIAAQCAELDIPTKVWEIETSEADRNQQMAKYLLDVCVPHGHEVKIVSFYAPFNRPGIPEAMEDEVDEIGGAA